MSEEYEWSSSLGNTMSSEEDDEDDCCGKTMSRTMRQVIVFLPTFSTKRLFSCYWSTRTLDFHSFSMVGPQLFMASLTYLREAVLPLRDSYGSYLLGLGPGLRLSFPPKSTLVGKPIQSWPQWAPPDMISRRWSILPSLSVPRDL